MRNVRSLPIVAMVAALLLGGVTATHPQTPAGNCRYFAETGHYVCDEFLEFFETRGELEIFGYPLTEAFDDPARGLRVQYFQRARMEWHPYNPEPYRVQLGLLVDELGHRFPRASPEQIPIFNNSLYHYFPETGHVVSYAFLGYFRERGGLDIFGYPRSEFMLENGYIVQYFQRARMEWHPEEPAGSQMRLTNLGELYIERFGIPGDYDEPLPPPSISGDPSIARPTVTPLRISISASVRYVIIGREGTQTVFVYVTDQWQQPVQGAAVKMVIHYPSGDQWYEFRPTNASGFTRYGFDLLPSPPGRRVVIDVTVTYGGLTATTQAFFIPWW
ncbi:MAG: LGFP repeat-containing protein [Anaerolineae bacterium]